jgi:hypothetical protein
VLRDRASLSDIFVNGEAVTERVLKHGDHIRIGRRQEIELLFMIEGAKAITPALEIDNRRFLGLSEDEASTRLLESGSVRKPSSIPRAGQPPRASSRTQKDSFEVSPSALGLALGGQLTQKIYSDPHGLDTWDSYNYAEVFIHVVSPDSFSAITGEQAPPSPISRAMYEAAGFGWITAADDLDHIGPSPILKGLKTSEKSE